MFINKMWKYFKKTWMKSISIYNRAVIQCLLTLIWFLVLGPTAIIKRFWLNIFHPKQKEKISFLKRSDHIKLNHFKNPF